MTDHHKTKERLVADGLGRIADDISRLVRPCIRIHTKPTNDEDIPVGASKFGGLPDAPADFSWPEWNGQPLGFLGQINLSTIAKNQIADRLPSNGLLSFFYICEQTTWGFDPEDKGSWRVYHFSNVSLSRTRHSAPNEKLVTYVPCELSFDDGLTLPGWESLDIESLKLTKAERNKYCDFEIDEKYRSESHQLLGHPKEVQGEMQVECQMVSNGVYCGGTLDHTNSQVQNLASGASQWRLLFQCDSDDNPGWMWGDVGRLYFWITESDLMSGRFENTWMILQCC